MTVTTTTASQTFQGNSTATAFPCQFEIFQDTDINVYFVNPTTGTQSQANLNSDYTVSGAGASSGFTVNTTVPVPTGTNLYVVRALPLTQPTDFTNQGAFFPTLHEAAFDRLCMLVQQIANYSEGLNVTMSPGLVPQPSTLFPIPQAGSLIGWNAIGNALVNTGASGVGAGSISDVNIASNAAVRSTKLSNTQTGAGAIARTLQAKLSEFVSVLDFGADPTGAADSTAAFNAAMTASANVYVPAGTYLLGDAVTLGTGQKLVGADRRKSILRMPSTFNQAAQGLLVFSSGEPGPTVEHLCVIQDQPNSVTPMVYPPAIYAEDCARFAVRFCRVACVYNGIDMKGNSGGAVIDDLEMSALNVGIDIDGSLDIVRISKLHYWPFAGAGFGTMTANQLVPYLNAYGIHTGRCDGLLVSGALFYGTRNALVAYAGSSGNTFGTFSDCDFDSSGGLIVSAGEIYVTGTTFSLGDAGGVFANVSGSTVQFSNCNFICSVLPAANGFILQSGGANTTFSGCTFRGAALDKTLAYAVSGSLVVCGCLVIKNAGTYGQPLFRYNGVVGAITGCYVAPGTSGNLAQVDSDTGVLVTGNVAPNWGVVMPSGTAPNTRVVGNVGRANADEYAGYFSSDASTTVKLPLGWILSRLGVGNYSITHNLGLSASADLVASLAPDTALGSAACSIAESTINAVRIRTGVAGTAGDCGVFFRFKRYRG